MRLDKTKIIFEKWEQLENKKVKLLLNTGEEKIGTIESFTHGTKNFIAYWILKSSNSPFNLLFEDGEWIKSSDILEIYFYSDNSIIIL
ncbi:hypothetical protein [Flavobacterium sp. H122]|uniref:hypothetical protein n=1 Tax=Flavobacterium sp. H122 TaxID=2529860 RepID=UPI0010AB4D06|nr:hypothetical protein [Flavobacterium sp. H122]